MFYLKLCNEFSSIKKDFMEDTNVIAKEGTSKNTIRNGNYLPKLQTAPILLHISLYNRHLRHFREDEEDAPSQIVHLIGSLPHRDAQAYQHLSPFVLQQ